VLTEREAFNSRRTFFFLVAGYFLLHVLLRVFVSNSVELDEAEQLILAQNFQWGYGPKLPLYSWIQRSFFLVFGVNVFSLSLLKNLLLFCTYAFTFGSAREITHSDRWAIFAAVSLFLIPQIAWESQRDLTHSVLVTTVAASSLFFFVRLLKHGRWWDYLAFGALAGFGLLSKFNYALFLAALLLGAFSMKEFRPRLLENKLGLGLILGAAIWAPYGLWMSNHWNQATSHSKKLSAVSGAITTGVVDFFNAALAFSGVWLAFFIIACFICGKKDGSAPRDPRDIIWKRFFERILLSELLMFVFLIVFFGVTSFKDRWFQPLLFFLPVYGALILSRRLSHKRLKGATAFIVVIPVLILFILPSRTLLAGRLNRPCDLTAPYGVLSDQIKALGFENGVILAPNSLVAGNLKLQFPKSKLFSAELSSPGIPKDKPVLLAWEGTPPSGIPISLKEKIEAIRPGNPLPDPHFLTAPHKFLPEHEMSLGVVLLR